MIQVSIIIPVYNDSDNLKKTLKAIEKQDYPKEKMEVLVVDNGSTDDTREIAKSFSFVQLLQEEQYLGSPYSARNRGIEASKGDIVVLLDSTCSPVENWLSKGIACFENKSTDIIAGNVILDINESSSLSEIYDAVTNIQIQNSVQNRGVAPTANLFIKKKLFEKIGLFPEGVRSGGDHRWTKRATNSGFNLTFCKEAVSYKQAREFRELIKKQWRVSTGQPSKWLENGKNINLGFLILVFLGTVFLFPFINKLKANENTDINLSLVKQCMLYILHYFISLVMKGGNIYGYLFHRKRITQAV